MNIIIVAEGAIDREGNAITPHAVKEVIGKKLAMWPWITSSSITI